MRGMVAVRWTPVLLVAAALVAGACGRRAGDGAQAETRGGSVRSLATLNAADVAVAQFAALRTGIPLSGALEPKVRVTVGAPMAEQLVEMYVNEGDRVEAGQRLAKFKDQVLQAAAAYANSDVATQRMNVRVAEAESARAVALFAEGAIAQRDRDNSLAALEGARSRLALATSQATSAEDRLGTAVLRAPVAGVVSRRYAQAGDRIDNGKPVMELVDTRVLQLTASVPTAWLPELRVGRPVSLTVAQMDSAQVAGRISRINPTADPATRQIQIYVDVPNPRQALVGGLFVSGRVVTKEAPHAVAVPNAAVRTEGESRTPVVYVVAGGRIARRPVVVGVTDAAAGLTEIARAVAAGDTVVIGPIEGLADGTPVAISGAAAPAPGPQPKR
ncbi:MAG TPA: efflux RND transporter periplasmic adaptor subunit [Gemmatimonadales bacterium]|nr:efflux RND transporter periplasmic adaptor subunit [Gemmatimonadales bacterium]